MLTRFLINIMDRKTHQQQQPHQSENRQITHRYSTRMVAQESAATISTTAAAAGSMATVGNGTPRGKKNIMTDTKSTTSRSNRRKGGAALNRDDGEKDPVDNNVGMIYRYYDNQSAMALPSAMTSHQTIISQSANDKNKEALRELQENIPEISKIFDVQCRIGSGTFSTVLLGTLQRERCLTETQRRRYAIKHHNPTSHPERILRELECMFRIGGVNNVMGINCCLRYNNNVAFVMPYMTHDRFHDIYRNMSLQEVKDYIRNLLIALRHVHKFNVIHRDVKPSNILYNRHTGKFLLCDFGLAQRIAEDGTVIQTSEMTSAAAAALLRDIEAAKHLMMKNGYSAQDEADEYLAKASRERALGGGGGVDHAINVEQRKLLAQTRLTKKELSLQKADTLRLVNRLRFMNSNVDPNNYVVSTKSMRKETHASRAGTPGYRPPEVLMRYPFQTTAVDVWAVGVIMLSFLSSLHPFFKAPNDCAAMSEIINLFGDMQVRKTAFMLDRLLLLSQKVVALDLRRVCMRFRLADFFLAPDNQRRHRRADGSTEMCRNCEQPTFNCVCKHSNHAIEQYEGLDMFPLQAYDLLTRLLEVDPTKRITADEALKHPFFSDHHRISSGIPLHLQQQQQQEHQSNQSLPAMRQKETLTMAASRTLKPYSPYVATAAPPPTDALMPSVVLQAGPSTNRI
ncbi:cell division cycle 7-related protein kinase isoform X2 [Drosophila tropicalis]|uniref:cell division cycle 7-related protein kinase isoform X2 n=1 Tax=Drosophila tropicalis TaxID=46794 RepID=UPI0035AB7445